MKIVILGAGSAGSSVASALASEENDITVIDYNDQLLDALKSKFDIKTIQGNAAHPKVLEQAEVLHADIVIAVTDRDETNMLACLIISKLYSRPKTIARVRAIDFLKNPKLFEANGIPVDVVISPEQIVMKAIRNLIEFPGVLHISDYAGGLVRLFSVKAVAEGFLTNKKIKDIKQELNNRKIRVVAIFRHGKQQEVNGSSIILSGDEVFFVAPSKELRRTLKDLRTLEAPIKRIILAGGGHIGKRLALALENSYHVKIIEKDLVRAKKIANDLNNTLVLQGDCTDPALLTDESIASTDLFCSVTENDGINIVSASLAKSLGVGKAICLLNQNAYAKLLPRTGIDVAVLPNQETLGSILKHVRHGDVAEVNSLCGGTAEAIEAIVHQYPGEACLVGKTVKHVNFPKGIVLGSVVRNQQVICVHHDTTFEEGDHVIMFAINKKLVSNIEKIFEVPA